MEIIKKDFCIVGGGFAGLAAARKLIHAKHSVVVLEARNRVGGRVYTETLPDATKLEWGGTFIGEGHERLYQLVKEMGGITQPTNTTGEKWIFLNGKAHRFSETIPRLNPFVLADLGMALQMLYSMSQKIPLEAPWDAENSKTLDSQTIGAWIDSPFHPMTETAKKILRSIWTEIFTSDPSEVSLLHALFIAHTLKSVEWIISDKGGAQQDFVVGGMQSVAEKLVKHFNIDIKFQSPVRKILQNGESVTVFGDGATIQASRVIVAIPPFLAGRIHYEPLLPTLRSQLMDRSSLGQLIRCNAVYSEPFWRAQGLSGMSIDVEGIPQGCIDASPNEGTKGILTAYIWGPPARELAQASAHEKRKVFLDGLVKRFGPKAQSPLQFGVFDWAEEEWSRGAVFAHYAPGVLTGFGKAIREPCDRIHWAGTETAVQWSGTIEGAIRSGERAADEVLQAQNVLHATTGITS